MQNTATWIRPCALSVSVALTLIACGGSSERGAAAGAPEKPAPVSTTGTIETLSKNSAMLASSYPLAMETDVSLQVHTPGLTDRYLRHAASLASTGHVDAGSSEPLKNDATFRVVAGLADASCYSLRSRNYPNSYVRHQNFRVRVDPHDNSDLFKRDATFCTRHGLGGGGVSFEALNMPGQFLRHYNGEAWMAAGTGARPSDSAASFAADATWNIADAWAGTNAGAGGKAAAIPIGIENVNDSPMKAANYRTLLRFVPDSTIAINRFYFGFKLLGAACHPSSSEYGRGDGGLLRASLVTINPDTGLPGTQIATETVNACVRFNQAKAEVNGATPVLVWANTAATLQAGSMYGVIISNAHANPAGNFFGVNMPLADTALAGPHTRNELNARASGAIMSLDPRAHVAWSANNGASWQYGSDNGQYRSYMNNRDTAHPATRMPQYGFRLTNGSMLGAQPYYAYSDDCIGCTVAYANVRYARTYTQVGGFIASGSNVGTLVMKNTSTGATSRCTPAQGYGFRTCTLAAPIPVAVGQSYTISSTGAAEIMKMDWSQRQLFPDIGSVNGNLRAYQPNPAAGTNAQDVPSLWAGPLSGYFN